MLYYGLRIIYDKQNGKVLNGTFGEICGDLQEGLRPKEIDFIDIPYGYNENNFNEAMEYHIDITKDKNTTNLKDLIVIDKYIKHEETEEEKLSKELLKAQSTIVDLKYKELLNNKNLEKEGR